MKRFFTGGDTPDEQYSTATKAAIAGTTIAAVAGTVGGGIYLAKSGRWPFHSKDKHDEEATVTNSWYEYSEVGEPSKSSSWNLVRIATWIVGGTAVLFVIRKLWRWYKPKSRNKGHSLAAKNDDAELGDSRERDSSQKDELYSSTDTHCQAEPNQRDREYPSLSESCDYETTGKPRNYMQSALEAGQPNQRQCDHGDDEQTQPERTTAAAGDEETNRLVAKLKLAIEKCERAVKDCIGLEFNPTGFNNLESTLVLAKKLQDPGKRELIDPQFLTKEDYIKSTIKALETLSSKLNGAISKLREIHENCNSVRHANNYGNDPVQELQKLYYEHNHWLGRIKFTAFDHAVNNKLCEIIKDNLEKLDPGAPTRPGILGWALS